ncbi:hypothetical protein [Saccharothrix syringae]|uniref:Uncharacterized protein n=1 Tax=Saccharothrix syringae TaxID=103733 RepID=A0A5Q0H1K0_SACSY|nr:hypothetical protein [Saccharothrix syringae]QFZ20121.1 hypothetical protein EKG83_24295 [Saccharothrix syringae]
MTRPSGDEVRSYLLGQVDLALRRPDVYGGEMSLPVLLRAAAFAHGRVEDREAEQEAFRARGVANAAIVGGGVEVFFGFRDHDLVASVYAEGAHRRGRLTLDRTPSPAEHRRLRGTAGPWAAVDRDHHEVVDEFGPPSVLIGGTNPKYGKTLGYGTADPLVFFHLWNGNRPGDPDTRPPPRPEPLLLAVRHGDAGFADAVTFTPRGADLRARFLDAAGR